MRLLRSKVRLDRPEANLPETLASDAGRLAAARDDVDRVTLVATLCVLVRQVRLFPDSRSSRAAGAEMAMFPVGTTIHHHSSNGQKRSGSAFSCASVSTPATTLVQHLLAVATFGRRRRSQLVLCSIELDSTRVQST